MTEAGLGSDVSFALQVYGLNDGSNFRDPHHPEDGWKNVIYLAARPRDLAAQMGLTRDEWVKRRARINQALLTVRNRRSQPATDDKILSGWNGLMIAGLADCGRLLKEPKYVTAAKDAADFVLHNMRSADGGLQRTYRAEQSKIDGFLSDYALMIRGLLALNAATDDPQWLQQAEDLAVAAHARFWDDHDGGYFDTLADRPDLFVRSKSSYDGAVPSGNGAMALDLIRLYELTGNEQYVNDAQATLSGLSANISENAVATAKSTTALHRLLQLKPDWQIAETRVSEPKADSPVSLSVDRTQVELKMDDAQTIHAKLAIDPAYHINSNQPGQDDLIPLKIELMGGEGVEIEVDYPTGESYRGELSVYRGDVEIPITLHRTGRSIRGGQLQVTYQACRDEACLRPQTLSMEVKITAK